MIRYLPYLFGMLIGLTTFGVGLWLGARLTKQAYSQAVDEEKAKLLIDQAEVRRMALGQKADLIDGDGKPIVLKTISALRRLSDGDLEALALTRGLIAAGNTREELITAITTHQRALVGWDYEKRGQRKGE